MKINSSWRLLKRNGLIFQIIPLTELELFPVSMDEADGDNFYPSLSEKAASLWQHVLLVQAVQILSGVKW